MAPIRSLKGVLLAALAILLVPSIAASAVPGPDPLRGRQWGLDMVGAPDAWQVGRGEGVLIAIVDSGVDLDHPDLAAKLVVHAEADFVDPGGPPQDENGHGTHLAGIAAASTQNSIGVAGVAPAATILPVRVLDADANGTARRTIAGIRYAADRGADVINLSLNYGAAEGAGQRLQGNLSAIDQAVEYAWDKGAVVVFSAGNADAPLPICSEPAVGDHVLCVGAVDRTGARALYSNGDATLQENYLVAPGGAGTGECNDDILSTWPTATPGTCVEPSGYASLPGTSMSAAFVSGVAALLAGEGLGNDRILDCLLSTTVDLGPPGRDPVYGYGLVNADAAMVSCT